MWNGGFITVPRRLRESWVWGDRLHWCLDLVMMAWFRDGLYPFCGTEVRVRRGQLVTTAPFMAKRWGIGDDKRVRRYWQKLERSGIIHSKVVTIGGTRDGTTCGTLITILNYDEWQGSGWSGEARRETTRNTTRGVGEEGKRKREETTCVSQDRTGPPTLNPRVQDLVSGIGNGPASPRVGGQPSVPTRKPEIGESELGPNAKLFFESVNEPKAVNNEEERGS